MIDFNSNPELQRFVETISMEDKISIKYIPVSITLLWVDNAKKHDIPQLIRSMQEYGFKDPPAFDKNLKALVEGNGRAEALSEMKKDGLKAPRGIIVDPNTGEWLMPVLFGVDASNEKQARRYALDHNNLVLAGGDFTAYDTSRMWETEGYKSLLESIKEDGVAPISINLEEIALLLDGFEFDEYEDMSDKDVPTEEHDDETIQKIIVETYNGEVMDELKEAINSLLKDHPEWEAKIAK